MASGGGSSSRQWSSSSPAAASWTQRQNKQFECALAVYDRETPDRWQNVARYMGGSKSPDEVRRHFERLIDDVEQIEAGRFPFPCYATPPAGRLDDASIKVSKLSVSEPKCDGAGAA
ncbi:hypothetical protein ACP70R_040685 [Stipagrostis hirtigluma subsp. patula]